MRGKITKRLVDGLKPGVGGAEAMLWDIELKGFGVRVQRGDAKSFVLHYRVGTGRGAPLRKLTIGRHGSPWTPETARKEAKTLIGLIGDGADPAADKMARRKAPTVAELAERFFAEHAEAKRKSGTAAEYKRLLDKIILPALGKRKAADVSRADVTKLHHANRAAPYQANRVLAVLSKMFNLAERWGLRPDGSGSHQGPRWRPPIASKSRSTVAAVTAPTRTQRSTRCWSRVTSSPRCNRSCHATSVLSIPRWSASARCRREIPVR